MALQGVVLGAAVIVHGVRVSSTGTHRVYLVGGPEAMVTVDPACEELATPPSSGAVVTAALQTRARARAPDTKLAVVCEGRLPDTRLITVQCKAWDYVRVGDCARFASQQGPRPLLS